jgi:osmotically-inducible protein OsmY
MMLGKLLLGAAAGGAAAWFLKNNEAAKSQVSRYAGQVKGAAQGVTPGAGREAAEERLNDPALARKVESEIFRDTEIPNGEISVNAEYGVIYLRGQITDREAMERVVERARAVNGVRGVENLTHLPTETAPTKQ